MKIGVGLFGIHYLDNLNHWMGWKHGVDYRETFHNQFSHMYCNHDVKYFGCTYHSPIENELMNDYGFTNVTFSEIDNSMESDPVVKRNKIFKNTVKLMLDSPDDYDYVILSRFDLHFKQHFSSLDIKTDKLNFLCGAKCGPDFNLVDDNFYFMPKHLLKGFYDTIETIPENISAHNYHKYFTDYNFMVEGSWYSHELPTYYILRIPPPTNKPQ